MICLICDLYFVLFLKYWSFCKRYLNTGCVARRFISLLKIGDFGMVCFEFLFYILFLRGEGRNTTSYIILSTFLLVCWLTSNKSSSYLWKSIGSNVMKPFARNLELTLYNNQMWTRKPKVGQSSTYRLWFYKKL